MATGSLHTTGSDYAPGGTGDRFARAVIIVAGVAALAASLITVLLVFPFTIVPTTILTYLA
jgi:hypothetical protein